MATNTSDYSKYFVLTADVNMAGQVFTTAIIAANPASGFSFVGTAFTGVFDGNHHKVTHFTINGGSYGYIGLFGYINTGGLIKNLDLENFAVSSSSIYIGGLVGKNSGGNIMNCRSTGTVTGGYYSSNLGGLAGYNDSNSISNCCSTGAVSGSSTSSVVGGLVGFNNSGSISNCYSTGTASGYSNVGGLVGSNGGNVSNCYSTGAVSSSSSSYNVGGLVGSNVGSVSNCYSTGRVSGSYYADGLVGTNVYNGSGNVNSSFWDKQTSGQSNSAGGIGKMTADMKILSTFTLAGWNFTTIWAICEGTNYPRLKWQIPATDWVCPNGVGIEDLNYFAQRWLQANCTSSNDYCGGTDINASGSVDTKDFAIFAQRWLADQ